MRSVLYPSSVTEGPEAFGHKKESEAWKGHFRFSAPKHARHALVPGLLASGSHAPLWLTRSFDHPISTLTLFTRKGSLQGDLMRMQCVVLGLGEAFCSN
jgi:hypothetical protein